MNYVDMGRDEGKTYIGAIEWDWISMHVGNQDSCFELPGIARKRDSESLGDAMLLKSWVDFTS